MTGRTADGRIETIRVVAEGSPVANYGSDVTSARLVTGLITERGLLQANRDALVFRSGRGAAEGHMGTSQHLKRRLRMFARVKLFRHFFWGLLANQPSLDWCLRRSRLPDWVNEASTENRYRKNCKWYEWQRSSVER
jgi:hypothetical protein